MESGLHHLTGPYASGFQLDHQQLDAVIMPDLQDMANNADLLEQLRQRRFDGDEPPPYRSPSPDDGDDGEAPVLWPTAARDQVAAEIEELIRRPLSDEELDDTQCKVEMWHAGYHPGRRYDEEAREEAYFMFGARRSAKHYAKLIGRAGEQREKIFIRHRIKRRWQRLGVWNPEWGIPGRVDEGPRDKTLSWKWKWQGDVRYRGADPGPVIPEHPNTRAFHLRRGLHRDQRGPLPPRRSLAADTSKSAAESFITSRPWFTFAMDTEEERTRLNRIPHHLASHDVRGEIR
ncbi:hypothetical protein G6O67_006632 [Ophiocordyceps sinensis]|uniref:Uncharacterized protein n=2 Tax=Ophiocordyceps sinensis TaxID=72228 RepID=A0A8H4PMZ1_9HYPO|nr:hypothetical protein OCS_04436 [Ophiocordyceps sinensis CO18]KAF4506561.1 hypothetical protein G6O67_006632 [Ophiocordyceps sinensis]